AGAQNREGLHRWCQQLRSSNRYEAKLLTVGEQMCSSAKFTSILESPEVGGEFTMQVLTCDLSSLRSLYPDMALRVSSETQENARCRVRTCDFLRVKQALYH